MFDSYFLKIIETKSKVTFLNKQVNYSAYRFLTLSPNFKSIAATRQEPLYDVLH